MNLRIYVLLRGFRFLELAEYLIFYGDARGKMGGRV